MPHPQWAAGQILKASDLNLLVVRGTYTPVLTAATNPNLGTFPTQQGQWYRTGSWIFVEFNIVFGTSPSAGSGDYAISVPFPIDAFTGRTGIGTANLRDNDTTNRFNRFVLRHATDNTKFTMETEGGTPVSANIPFTFAASDSIRGSVNYLIAE